MSEPSSTVIPAICNKCGTIFPSGFAIGEAARSTAMEGNTSGPCPECGGMGRIPNGMYDGIAGGVRALLRDPRDVQALQDFARRIDDLRTRDAPAEEIERELASAPAEVRGIIDKLGGPSRKALAVLATILALVIAYKSMRLDQEQVDLTREQMRRDAVAEQQADVRDDELEVLVRQVYDRLNAPPHGDELPPTSQLPPTP